MKRAARIAFVAVAGCGSLLGFDGDDEDGEIVFQSPLGDGGDATLGDGGSAADVTSESDASDGGSNDRQRLVFATEQGVTGAFGGLAQGDAICMAEAQDAGLGGVFVAWLSTQIGPVDAKSRLVTDAGWFLPGDGGVVFASPAAIANGSFPQNGIVRTARGEVLDGGEAWTGTRQDGTKYDSDCVGWTRVDSVGVRGILGATDETWTGAAPIGCTETRRLYCFEK